MILGTGARREPNQGYIKTGSGDSYFRAFSVILVLLLCLCASSWGACVSGSWSGYYCSGCDNSWGVSGCCSGGENVKNCGLQFPCSQGNITSCQTSSGFYTSPVVTGACEHISNSWWRSYLRWTMRCDTQAEADSVYCAQNPSAEGCVEEDVPQNCMEDYNLCMIMGGVWKKNGSDAGGCSSECNICDSKQQIRNKTRWKNVCCALGKAPPPENSICTAPVVPTGYGMSLSRLLSENGQESCGDTQTADGQPIVENAESFHRYCEEGEEYEEQVDTNSVNSSGSGDSSSSGSGDSSSSGEGGGSSDSGTSFGTELEALDGVYGVLDTIRDTLVHRLTPMTEEIRDCLYSFKLCAQLDSLYVDWSAMPKDSTWFYIDTGLVKYLKPFMDSSVKLDSNQLKAIRKLDTNALKQLRLDSALLENDTSTRRAVNSGFEGVLKNDTVTRRAVNRLDTTVVSLDSSLRKGIREGTDNLIDSMDRYLGRVDSSIGAVGSNGTPLGDSLGAIHGAIDGVVNSLDSSIRSGYGSADTGSGNFPWISQGESQRDSILGGGPGGTGFGGLDFGADSAWMDSMQNIGYTCDGDSCCIGGKCEYFESDSMIVDSLQRHAQRLGDSVRALNDAFYRDSVDNIFEEVKDSLKAFNPLNIFDSTLLSELGASIPNSNTCPEHCSTFQVDIPFFFGTQHAVIDWGLCMGRTAFANGNVLSFLRFIIRIIVAVTCITAVMWNAARIRR